MVLNRRGSNLGIFLLGAQVLSFGYEHIPPATLALIAGQAAIFLDFMPQVFRSVNSVCMSSYLVYHQRDWRRMFLSQFFHGDDMHLYFNMMSLLYKGTFLENKFGTSYFAYLISVFTALTGATYVGLGALMNWLMGDQSYLMSCGVGFSGVLFALKVLTTYYSPDGYRLALGSIPVPTKYFYWAELVLIQLMVPNASFVGHLAGILVGVAYVYGPLKPLMNLFLKPEPERQRRRRRRGNTSSVDDDDVRSQDSFLSNIFNRTSRGSLQYRSPTESTILNNTNNNYSGYRLGGGVTSMYGHGHAMPSAPPPESDPSSGIGFEGYNNNFGAYPNNNYGGYPPSQSPAYDRYTGGFDEDEQYRRAMEESLRDHRPVRPGLYPVMDDLRSRRANYFQ